MRPRLPCTAHGLQRTTTFVVIDSGLEKNWLNMGFVGTLKHSRQMVESWDYSKLHNQVESIVQHFPPVGILPWRSSKCKKIQLNKTV